MSLFVIDIDGTLANWLEREREAGGFPGRDNMEAYAAYLERLMDPAKMIKDTPIPGMLQMLRALDSRAPESVDLVYLTGRSEKHRQVTERWLLLNRFPQATLIMRPDDDWGSAAAYKEREMLKLKTQWGPNIVVIDDDGEGDCGEMYSKHGWTHLKVRAG